jgi:hypothetical protein
VAGAGGAGEVGAAAAAGAAAMTCLDMTCSMRSLGCSRCTLHQQGHCWQHGVGPLLEGGLACGWAVQLQPCCPRVCGSVVVSQHGHGEGLGVWD